MMTPLIALLMKSIFIVYRPMVSDTIPNIFELATWPFRRLWWDETALTVVAWAEQHNQSVWCFLSVQQQFMTGLFLNIQKVPYILMEQPKGNEWVVASDVAEKVEAKDYEKLAKQLGNASPLRLWTNALEEFGDDIAITFRCCSGLMRAYLDRRSTTTKMTDLPRTTGRSSIKSIEISAQINSGIATVAAAKQDERFPIYFSVKPRKSES